MSEFLVHSAIAAVSLAASVLAATAMSGAVTPVDVWLGVFSAVCMLTAVGTAVNAYGDLMDVIEK